MIIPVRCYSCGSLIAHKWEEFNEKLEAGIEYAQALDEVLAAREGDRGAVSGALWQGDNGVRLLGIL